MSFHYLITPTALFTPPEISEFVDKVLARIIKTLYDPIYRSVQKNMNNLFSFINSQILNATHQIVAGPKAWNSSAYNAMQTVAETICLPIAGCFITIIFCWQLISMVQDSNAMQAVKPDRLMFTLMKFCLCLYVCANSFKIIMAFCDLGIWAATKVYLNTNTYVSFSHSLSDLGLAADDYTFDNLMKLAGYWLAIKLALLAVWICGIIVYIRTMIWFVELLMYASAAPIPYSTWMNKEWSQVGMNYTRKMLALSFQGFFILLLFSLYGAVLSGLNLGDFTQSLVMILGCGFALAMMMFKAGPISESIFNAH